jgi:signal transduction histidine kinase
MLEKALASADRIIVEGRNRVSRLRADHLSDGELQGAIENLGRELNAADRLKLNVERFGNDAVLKDQAAEEVFYIFREALTNGLSDAPERRIYLSLIYARRYFAAICKDDGAAFNVKRNAKPDESGTQGMAKRAQKLGGQLTCIGVTGRGSEIRLTVPSYRAYVDSSRLMFYVNALRSPP